MKIMNFRIILRNLSVNRTHTLLNITGLALGLACAILIIARLNYELSFDRQLPDADRICRLTFETRSGGNTMHFARCWESWVSQFPGKFSQIEQLVRLSPFRHTAVKAAENKFYSDRIFSTDSNFFSVFNIELTRGNTGKPLNEPYTAVISATMAARLFGSQDCIGKTILMSGEYDTKMTLFTVTGIMKDTPPGSHIHFDILTSFARPGEAPDWAYVYLLLRKGSSPGELAEGIKTWLTETKPEGDQISFTPFLQKITDIHLHSDKDRELEPNGNVATIYLYIFIVVIILIVSWTNFINLNRARLLNLRKQNDILRINGASELNILIQAVTESAISCLAALLLALFLTDLLKSSPGRLAGFIFLPSGFKDTGTLPSIIILYLLSVLAGSLPLLGDLAGRVPVPGKPGGSEKGRSLSFSSSGLILGIQFCLATGLIVAAITIYRQKELILAKEMGKRDNEVLVFEKLNWEIRGKYQQFKTKALQNPYIKDFTAAMEEPSNETMDAMAVESTALDPEHKDRQLYVLPVEDNFIEFFNLKLIAGQTFRKFDPGRKAEDYILNETAARELGWTPEEAVGKPLKLLFGTPDIIYGGTITGVVSDFNFNTLRHEIKPYILFQKPIFFLTFMIETDRRHSREAIEYLQKIWEEELPDYPFHYEHLDDLYKEAYSRELNQSKLTGIFSLLAVILICMGLFSVTSLLVTRRTKEIGIRRVNGASPGRILIMMASGFFGWFAAAMIVAFPLSWLIMNRWLSNFAYHIKIEWWYFVLAAFLVFSVSFLTVTVKSLRAATANPAESLRYE